MDDLSICKRIAEIEGIKSKIDKAMDDIKLLKQSAATGITTSSQGFVDIYNPLTDDALCFQLMVKYEVNINRYYDSVTIDSDYNDKPPIASVSFSTDDVSINKAICLAIIEAYKGNNQ